MEYSEMTYKSRSRVKRFAHNSRYKLSFDLCKSGKSIFDYGAGTGYFLSLLSKTYPNIKLVGYEPIYEVYLKAVQETIEYKNVMIFNKIDFNDKFDFVTCFEVLEHFTEEEQMRIFKECKSLLSDNGKIIISVPIESGLSGFFKNVFRYLIKQSHAGNLKEVFMALFGIEIKRSVSDGFIYSHLGFRYRDLEKLLSMQGLSIQKRIFSPFNFLGPILNSQVFYVIEVN